MPKSSERRASHTLTVREAARLFESAGVARTERSIINWCQLNKQGVSRLDCYFDPNERKYYITQQGMELAIKEEQSKAVRVAGASENVGTVPKADGNTGEREAHGDNQDDDPTILKREIRDLKITNQAKDYYIDRLEKEREDFVEIDKLQSPDR